MRNVRTGVAKFYWYVEFGALQNDVHLIDLSQFLRDEYLVAKIGFDIAENWPFTFR